MSYFSRKIFALSSQVLVTSLVFSSEVKAQEVENIQKDMTDIPSVAELSEVESEEWNFQVLRDFIQRYNIDTKYPLANFQNDGVVTRYEFAVLLNDVIQHIDNLENINKNIKGTNLITQEELNYLSKLQHDFAFELHGINQRIEKLETQTVPQFSTTSKLSGEVIFALTAVGEGNKANDDEKTDSNITFSSRTKLQLNSTFSGRDRLKTSLKTSNIQSLDSATGTNMTRLSSEGDDKNKFKLGDLTYRFRMGKQARVYIGAKGLEIKDFTNTINPYLDGNDDGAVSRFAQRNPIYRQGGGAGIGVEYKISDSLELGLGYIADDAERPKYGLTKSDYAAISQLTFKPNKMFILGLNYIHSFNNLDTNTGSDRANDPFNDNSESINANSFGLQGSVALNKNLFLGSWVGYTHATANDLPNKPTANILNWAFTLAIPDLGKKGNLGGLIIGQPPKLINNQYQLNGEEYTDKDTSLHLEAFYRFKINDNMTITPGIVVITNPEHNSDNDTVYLGTLRTTFSF